MNSVSVESEKDFGPGFKTSLHWMNESTRFVPAYYVNEQFDCHLDHSVDFDFVGFAFESLAFIKQKMEIVYVTDLCKSKMPSSKILWQGKAVHNMLNTHLGTVDEHLEVYVVFPDTGNRDPSEVIHEFFEHVVYEGVLSSPMYRNTPIALPYQECIGAYEPGAIETLEDSTMLYLQLALEDYLQREDAVKPIFIVQQYGQKRVVKSAAELSDIHTKHAALFNLDMVSAHKLGQKAMSYIDLASDISCRDDAYVTMFWNRNLYPMLSDSAVSPFAELMIPNSTVTRHARAQRDFYTSPTIQEYPNFGIGSLASCIIEYKNEAVLLRKLKLYQRGSQEFRHAVPFSNVWHALLAFPFEKVKAFVSGAGAAISNAVLKRLRDEVTAVASRQEFNRAKSQYSTFMPQKAYGPRIELTLQNATHDQLLRAYQLLNDFSSASACTYNSLKAFCLEQLAAPELMRCSPLQTVLTSTVCLFPQMFTESISTYLYLLLDKIIDDRKNGLVEYNEHWVRLAFILQDQLMYIWTGSVQSLVFPKLFLRYKLDQCVLSRGHYYISPQLLVLGDRHEHTKLHLPVVERFQVAYIDAPPVDQQLEVDNLDLMPLPPRFVYSLLPQGHNLEDVQAFMERVKLCMQVTTGVVKPLEKSTGWIIASNLVNGLFLALFTALGIGHSEQKQAELLDHMRGISLTRVFDFVKTVCPAATTNEKYGSLSYEDVISVAFPLGVDKREFPECQHVDLAFKKQWHLARSKVVAEMNIKFKSTGTNKLLQHEQHLVGYTPDVLTPDSIQSKMVCLLKSLKLYFFPHLSKSYFWGKDGNFAFQRVASTVAIRAVVRPDSFGRPVIIRDAERLLLDSEMRIKLIDHIIYNSSLLKECKKKPEVRSHCVFHALKTDPEAFFPYKAGLRDWIFKTGLFVLCPKKKPIVPVPDSQWIAVYRQYFPKK